MNFASDNTASVSPEILEALAKANDGAAMPYGDDFISTTLHQRFNDIFECETTVFLVATGTAANSLALSAMSPSYGNIYCHQDAHINRDECGAPEFFTHGAKLVPLRGTNGKVHPGELDLALSMVSDGVHHTQPAALSLSQASEAGTIYGPAEIRHLSDAAKEKGLYVHMDGARFTNALCTAGCSAADLTWKAGVDVLTFGATKNGAMCAEAIVIFNEKIGQELGYKRKRSGHLFSKMRYLAAQWEAYFENDLWLKNARHANEMAQRLKTGLESVNGADFMFPVEANEMFVKLPDATLNTLQEAGYGFYRWPERNSTLIRLVTSFNTKPEDVDGFIQTARGSTQPKE